MKKKTKLSTYSIILTTVILILLLGMIINYIDKDEPAGWVTLAVILGFLCLMALFYMPCAVELGAGKLTVIRPLWFKSIKLSDIAKVGLCPPTMAARRIIGSGGFMGYWGWFRERDLGKYFAYHGKSSDCFLVILKNGRKYMLGCEDAPEMVEAIRDSL